MCFDGENEYYLSKEERNKHFNFETDYLLVVRRDNKLTLREEYDAFIQDADNLKKQTNNFVNLYKTGYKDKVVALDLFDRYTKHIAKPPKILQAEADYIKKASQGAIIFTDDYTGPGWKYDICSMYPSMMNSGMLFPIKEGEFMHLTKDDFEQISYFKYGIYRVVITYDKTKSKVFRWNKKNHYTHFDLTLARELGLEFTIIEDGQANFLFYSRDKLITGTELFGNYVNQLFELKQQKVPRSKDILNVLWGSLSEHHVKKTTIKNTSSEIFIIPDNSHFNTIKPFDDENTHISITNNDNQYVSGFGRICPFLISKGRCTISKIMRPYVNNVVRCHTDGIICNVFPSGLEIGNGLGELRYEGYNDNYVRNGCSYNKDDFKP